MIRCFPGFARSAAIVPPHYTRAPLFRSGPINGSSPGSTPFTITALPSSGPAFNAIVGSLGGWPGMALNLADHPGIVVGRVEEVSVDEFGQITGSITWESTSVGRQAGDLAALIVPASGPLQLVFIGSTYTGGEVIPLSLIWNLPRA